MAARNRPLAPAAARSDPSSLDRLTADFATHLAAENKALRTIGGYSETLRQFDAFLVARGMPRNVGAITREHVEAYLIDVLGRHKPSTAATRYKGLRVFFKWATEEGEVPDSPMRNLKPPAIPEEPVPVVSEDEIRRVLKVCAGTTFEDQRDNALLRLLYDTGMRRGEASGLRVADIDWDAHVALVLGKGRRPRSAPSATRLLEPCAATSGPVTVTPTPTSTGCGSASRAASGPTASARWSSAGAGRRASRASTPTASGTPSPTAGWPRAATRVISCGWPAGGAVRCSSATESHQRV